jgi:hypothetical protein
MSHPESDRIIAAIGSYLEKVDSRGDVNLDKARCALFVSRRFSRQDSITRSVKLGGETIFYQGQFVLDGQKEQQLFEHLKVSAKEHARVVSATY